MEFNVVAAGIGGQGIIFFSEILAKAMLSESMNASFYVHSGLAQLGGSVRSHIRTGDRICPKISLGCADVIISLELAEILHAIPYVKRSGIAIICEEMHQPYHSRMDPEKYPDRKSIEKLFNETETRCVFVPAGELAKKAGHLQALNMVMLGSLVGVSGIVETESAVGTIRGCLDRGQDLNVEAFWKGYEFIKGQDYV